MLARIIPGTATGVLIAVGMLALVAVVAAVNHGNRPTDPKAVVAAGKDSTTTTSN
jgi:hypothetical protein